MRKLLLFVVLLFGTTTLVACAPKAAYDFDSRDTIVIGMEADYAPFNWATSSSTSLTHPIDKRNDFADGYDVQIAKLIAEGLNKRLVIKAIGWKGLIPAANSGQIDLIIAGMTPTDERAKSVLFTEEYYSAEPVLIIRKDSTFINGETINDFINAKVVAQQGTIYESLVDQLVGAKPQTSLETYNDLYLSVKNKVSDVIIAELPVAQSMANQDGELTFIRLSDSNGFEVTNNLVIVSIASALRNTDLVTRVNAILASISNEEREALMQAAIQRQ